MSKTRQDAQPSVRGYAVTHPPGRATLPVQPGWHQLVYAAAGTMTVTTTAGAWTVPPHRALWIPDADPASITNRGTVAVRTLYVSSRLPALAEDARAIEVSGLVREVLLQLIRLCPLDLTLTRHSALFTVLVEESRQLPPLSLLLPLPVDDRASVAAAAMTTEPAEPLTAIIRRIGASRRTLERVFVAETGLALGAWRRRARILSSLAPLADGASITSVSVRAGYSTPSAYVAAFKLELGQTPRRFLQR